MGISTIIKDALGAGLRAFEEFRENIEAVAISGADTERDAKITIAKEIDAATAAEAYRYDEFLAVFSGAPAWSAKDERQLALHEKTYQMVPIRGGYYGTPTLGDAKAAANSQIAAYRALNQPVAVQSKVDPTPAADSNEGVTIISGDDLLARIFGGIDMPDGFCEELLNALFSEGIITPLGAAVSDSAPIKVNLAHLS